jgi:hypothetical protein
VLLRHAGGSVSNWFIEDEDVTTETDQQIRDREIRTRLHKARQLETVDAMKKRYEAYDASR